MVLLKNFLTIRRGARSAGRPPAACLPRRFDFAPGRRIAVSHLSSSPSSRYVDTSIRRYVDTSIRRYVDTSIRRERSPWNSSIVEQKWKQRGGVSAASLSRCIAGPTDRRDAVTPWLSNSLELFAKLIVFPNSINLLVINALASE